MKDYEASLYLQKAIVKIIKGLGYEVYDFMPDEKNTKYPYIMLGAELLGDVFIKELSSTHYVTLHIWTGEEGQVELKRIISKVIQALTYSKIELEGGYEVGRRRLRLSSTHREIDANREQVHGVVQFDFHIRQV